MCALSRSPLLDNGDSIPSKTRDLSHLLRPVQAGALLHNARLKIYPDGSIREIMIASRPIFNPVHAEKHVDKFHHDDCLKIANERMFVEEFDREYASAALGDRWETEKTDRKAANLDRARHRARTAVFDLAACNRFDLFITLTVDPARADRQSYAEIMRTLNAWLSNRVQRKGLKYVAVPEFHKDGKAIHFHALCNDVLEKVDSGHRDKHRRKVYNLPEWPLGFTTAVKLTGEYLAVCRYICKYVTKADQKIGGRWYLSGGDLLRPSYLYADMPLDAVDGKRLEIPQAALTLCVADGDKIDFARIGEYIRP